MIRNAESLSPNTLTAAIAAHPRMRRLRSRVRRAFALVLALLVTPHGPARAFDDAGVQQLRALSDQLEAAFPALHNRAEITVGSFDPASGRFVGLRTRRERVTIADPPTAAERARLDSLLQRHDTGDPVPSPDGGAGRGPGFSSPRGPQSILVAVPPDTEVAAVRVLLRFLLPAGGAGGGRTWVDVNGRRVTWDGHSREIVVDAGLRRKLVWTLVSGTAHVKDSLIVDRPPLVGAGVFRLPAVPVGILYAPPQDRARSNQAELTRTTSFRIVQRLGRSRTESTTSGMDVDYGDVTSVAEKLGKLGGAIQEIDSPATKVAGAILGKMSDLLGQAKGSETAATTSESDSGLVYGASMSQGFRTEKGLGPGEGDTFVLLRNVTAFWLADGESVTLTILGSGSVTNPNAKVLREDLDSIARGLPTRTGLDAPTLRGLLAMDPLVDLAARPAGTFRLAPPRYADETRFTVFPGGMTLGRDEMRTDVSGRSTIESALEMREATAGLLSVMGIGPAADGTTRLATQWVTGSEASRSVTSSEVLQLNDDATDETSYNVAAYVDQLFGTLAAVPVAEGGSRIVGVVEDGPGRTAGTEVEARVGRDVYRTRTTANGRFEFRIPEAGRTVELHAGSLAKLAVVGDTTLVRLAATRVQRL